MIIKDGRFGAYVTDGEINATLRRQDDPETITAERAAELLAEKRPKVRRPSVRRKANEEGLDREVGYGCRQGDCGWARVDGEEGPDQGSEAGAG